MPSVVVGFTQEAWWTFTARATVDPCAGILIRGRSCCEWSAAEIKTLLGKSCTENSGRTE